MIKIFLFHERNKWRLNLFGIKSVPIYSFDPWMIFNLFNSMKSKSIFWFSLNQSIDKIGSLKTPSVWNFRRFNLSLFSKHILSDLISGSTIVRSSSSHKFIGNHSQSKIVWNKAMILPAYNLGGHVTWCSTCVWRVIGPISSCNT